MKISGLLKNLALSAASLTLTAGLLEGAARLYAGHVQGDPGTSRDPLLQFDPRLGWSKPPGARGTIARPEYEVPLAINARGLRGPDRPYQKPPGVRRVLLLGDSFVEGYTVPEHETVRARLEALLGRAGPAEVLNGGTHGWSTDQQLLFFAAEGRRYAADEVVLLFYHNDLYGNVSGDGKPVFEVRDGALILRNSPVPEPRGGDPHRQRPFTLRAFRGSMALRLLSNRTVGSNPELHRVLARLGLAEAEDFQDHPPQLWPFGPAHLREVDDMWHRTTLLLTRLRGEVEGAGGRLTVFYVPARFEVNDASWDLTRRRNGWGPRWKRERVVVRLADTLLDLGLPFVDPRAAFRRAEEDGTSTYFPQDGHWTAAGHRLAAERIAAALGGPN